MQLYVEFLKLVFRKFILRQSTGTVLKKASSRLGVVYIKFAQILATQNYGNLFTEEDRKLLSGICDSCNPISYNKIEALLAAEYEDYHAIFAEIDPTPVGSASVSQVHRARLVSGEEVAIKIKRQDIAKNVARDIVRLKKLIHRFGPVFKFGNYGAGDRALDMFLNWIGEETDFRHEQDNLLNYQAFAQTVNGHVINAKKIVTPKLYQEYCTDNVIVMEFIHHKTINQLELTEENKEKMRLAINSYFKNSFYALLHDIPVIFHGDPHGGNIYIDDEGNIGFLDLGLIFNLSNEDCKLIREFFLAAYGGDSDQLFELLVRYADMDAEQKRKFYQECCDYCHTIRTKDVTFFFTDMINICLGYEIVPPDFLFSMAKAFVCLNGINHFTDNKMDCVNLLREQILEYLVRRSVSDGLHLVINQAISVQRLIANSFAYGPLGALTYEVNTQHEFKTELQTAIGHIKQGISLAKISVLSSTMT